MRAHDSWQIGTAVSSALLAVAQNVEERCGLADKLPFCVTFTNANRNNDSEYLKNK